MSNHESLEEIFGEPISTYSRAQAIADGALVDVSTAAREAGFKVPVALTAGAWADCVAWTAEDSQRKGGWPQDESGRLWDVLWMLFVAIRGSKETKGNADTLRYQLYRVPTEGTKTEAELVTLKATIGGGDQGEPVFTIMLPGED